MVSQSSFWRKKNLQLCQSRLLINHVTKIPWPNVRRKHSKKEKINIQNNRTFFFIFMMEWIVSKTFTHCAVYSVYRPYMVSHCSKSVTKHWSIKINLVICSKNLRIFSSLALPSHSLVCFYIRNWMHLPSIYVNFQWSNQFESHVSISYFSPFPCSSIFSCLFSLAPCASLCRMAPWIILPPPTSNKYSDEEDSKWWCWWNKPSKTILKKNNNASQNKTPRRTSSNNKSAEIKLCTIVLCVLLVWYVRLYCYLFSLNWGWFAHENLSKLQNFCVYP